ncbi:hypothetical protein SLEP1_g43798 [Rubroshorea leprosula]|uniref:Uncharacterized protein n=1 Tax=Rubroshorea leprosula TaxID=152421 RepID=A0AAV5LE54_9ROSI|nr:hypothetical protein SLEP1_g43798 [Rubroshorea leprosula]
MKLSVQIAAYGIKVTFVNTQFIHAQVQAAQPEEQNHITLVSILDGLESEYDRKNEAKLGQQDQEQLAFGFHSTMLIEDGILDTDGKRKLGSTDMPAWKHNELGWSFPGKPQLQKFFFRRGCEDIGILKNSGWLLCNTFYELDPPGCNLIPSILSNGPLLPSTHVTPLAGRLNPEDSTWLDWLDKQVAGSVVYDAFGSTAKLSQLQLEELAIGLELTGNHFLWAARSDFVNGMNSKFMHYVQIFDSFERSVSLSRNNLLACCSNVACTTTQLDDTKKTATLTNLTFLSWQKSFLVMEVAKVDQGPVILVIMSRGGFDNAVAKNDSNKIVTVL